MWYFSMFSNIVPNVTSLVQSDSVYKDTDKNNSVHIYHTFQSIFGRICVHCNMVRKQEIPSLEEKTPENNDSTPPISTVTASVNSSLECLDNEKEKLLSSRYDKSPCEIGVQDVSFNDSMLLNSNDVDFLLKCSNSNNSREIDKNIESLYVKFDPLYAKDNTNTENGNLTFVHSTEFDVGYETGSTESMTNQSSRTMNSPCITLNILKEVPTLAVPPVVNEKVITYSPYHTPILVRSNSTFISRRDVPVSNLINLERNRPIPITQSSVSELQTIKNILQKQECELHQLRKENKYLKNLLQCLEKKKKMLHEQLASNLKCVTDENNGILQRQNCLLQKLKERTYDNEQLCLVMEEYEKTISVLINDQQKSISAMHEKVTKLQSDRDQALNHLISMETSFNDLLAKYKKSKSTIQELQQKEILYENKISKYELVIKQYQNMYLNVKEMTRAALNSANDTWANNMKNYTNEVRKLKATIKKHDITVVSLQESIVQKSHDNKELTAICEDLIIKIH